MAKLVVVFLIQFLILLLLVTQILLPLFNSKYEFFWFFKRNFKVKEKESSTLKNLSELEDDVAAKTEAYKDALDNVQNAEDQLKEIKSKTKIN